MTATLSATQLAGYFHTACDLQLHRSYHEPRVGSSTRPQPTSIAQSHFERGRSWEERLLASLEERGLLVRLDARAVIDGAQLATIMRAEGASRPRVYLSGVAFKPPTFEERYRAVEREPVRLGVAKPDLIELTRDGDRLVWHIIDAKSSARVKVLIPPRRDADGRRPHTMSRRPSTPFA